MFGWAGVSICSITHTSHGPQMQQLLGCACQLQHCITACSDLLNIRLQVCNLVAVSTHVPSAMKRTRWSLEDYTLIKHLHQGG